MKGLKKYLKQRGERYEKIFSILFSLSTSFCDHHTVLRISKGRGGN
ncbi:hypothetical protein B4091_2074 [Bacillus licheniformis]|nr:hypothetical protein B4091_2074 [Bacillus licheniformis]